MNGASAGGEDSTGLDALVTRGRRVFASRFGRPPSLAVAAPGRVNLIGEHTDYNGGFVLPMAIDRHVVALAAPAGEVRPARWRLWSDELQQEVQLPVPHQPVPGPPGWQNYPGGVLAGYLARGISPPSLDVVLMSSLPPGAGLSSSAALEVATALLLEAVSGLVLPPLERARLCQRAEQDHAGVPCGIMDQLISVAGQDGAALLIDCADDSYRAVPLPLDELAVLVTNTQVRHALGDGEYARRRAECQAAARALGVASLAAVSAEALDERAAGLPPVLLRRARHVISENARTLACARALAAGDLPAAGLLLYESHRSLRDDYQVSCPELDTLVDIAAEIGPAGGVLGARLTGGGFGGCTITLVHAVRREDVAAALAREYQRRTGQRTTPFPVRPVAGALRLTP